MLPELCIAFSKGVKQDDWALADSLDSGPQRQESSAIRKTYLPKIGLDNEAETDNSSPIPSMG